MWRPRLRFTIRQLGLLIALVALFLATLRTPFWPLLLGMAILLAGFAIERSQHGTGIIGAMVAGVIGFPCCVGMAYIVLSILASRFQISALVLIVFVSGLAGWFAGMVVGCWACMIVSMTRGRRSVGRSDAVEAGEMRMKRGTAWPR